MLKINKAILWFCEKYFYWFFERISLPAMANQTLTEKWSQKRNWIRLVNFTEALSRAGTNHEIETLYVEQTDDLIFHDSNMTS